MEDERRGFEKPNHTQTPNSFFDVTLPTIKTLAELKVVLAVIRQTFGWHKDADQISLSQLQKLTGMTRETVSIGINSAIGHGLLDRHPFKHSFLYSLRVAVGDSDQSDIPTSPQIRPKVVGSSDRELVGNSDPQKKGSKEKKERGGAHGGNGKDTALLHPLVVAYRDICHSTPNAQQRRDIISTVTDASLWDCVLKQFMREGRPPQRVDWTLERYVKADSKQSAAWTSDDLERAGV